MLPGEKFGRRYTLVAETYSGNNVTIGYPLTCEFSITRSSLARSNEGTFTVYNLNKDTRNRLFKDRFDLTKRLAIQFSAGYESMEMPLIFNGEIRSIYSERVGSDFKTEFDCFDGSFAAVTGNTETPVPAGKSMANALKSVMEQLPGILKANISQSFDRIFKRGAALSGNSVEILKELTENNFYIDNNEAFAMGVSDVTPGIVQIISSENGMIGTPKRSDMKLEVKMLFEPRLQISQGITLVSSTAKNYSGFYKIVGLQHTGVISGSVGGECTTTVTLWNGQVLKPVQFMSDLGRIA